MGDKYGRKSTIVISSAVMFSVGFVGAFMPNFALYTTFRYPPLSSYVQRVLLVTCIGFIIPITFSALAENTPMK